METVPTVRVQADNRVGYRVINKEKYDADPKAYTLHEGQDEPAPADEEYDKLAKQDAAQRKLQANRGVASGGIDPTANPTNSDGTYSEPTPSDIRFPDKTKTEFANNMGAFLNKSAAGYRKAAKAANLPGGLDPEGYKKFQKAERARKRREETAARDARASAAEASMGRDLEAVTASEGSDAEIPDDWQSLPWRDQVRLAQEIQDTDEKMTKSEAQEVIQAEVDRRAEAEPEEGEAEE